MAFESYSNVGRMKLFLFGYEIGKYYMAYGSIIQLIEPEGIGVLVRIVKENRTAKYLVARGWELCEEPTNRDFRKELDIL